MRKIAVICAFALVISTFCGCERVLEREFYYEDEHVQQQGDFSTDSVNEINSYNKLKNALLAAVRQGIETEKLRISSYDGDLEEDLRRATSELTDETPIGAFAISSIVCEHSHVMAYHDVNVTIQYKRTADEIASVVNVINADDFKRRVRNAMQSHEEKLLLEIDSYRQDTYSLDEVMRQYYSIANDVFGFTRAGVNTYPETGYRRVLEITFTWEDDVTAKNKASECDAAVRRLTDTLAGPTDYDTVKNIFDYITSNVEPDERAADTAADEMGRQPKTDEYTQYGAICTGRAAPEGFALAFSRLCSELGVENMLAVGKTAEGKAAFWNMVSVGDEWYHVDCWSGTDTREDGSHGPDYAWFLKTDGEMFEKYSVDRGVYPRTPTEPFDITSIWDAAALLSV